MEKELAQAPDSGKSVILNKPADALRQEGTNKEKIEISLEYAKKALEYHRLYADLKDKIYDEESAKSMAEMQTRYDIPGELDQLLTRMIGKDPAARPSTGDVLTTLKKISSSIDH
jgi:hypothetical protein